MNIDFKKFKVGDYVEIIPKDLITMAVCGGYISNLSNSKWIVLENDLMFTNEIPYSKIESIRHIIFKND